MKTNITVIPVFILLLAFGCAETGSHVQTSQSQASKTEGVSEPQLYTAYNIWRVRDYAVSLMRCINHAYPVSTGSFASAEFARLCPLS